MIRTTLVSLLAGVATLAAAANTAQDFGVTFALRPVKEVGKVQLTFTWGEAGRGNGVSSNTRSWSALQGLDPARLSAEVQTPASFRLVREAGVLDCTGTVGRNLGSGACDFVPDESFADAVERRGVGRLDREKQFHLTLQGARLAALDALKTAGLPTRRWINSWPPPSTTSPPSTSPR